MKILTTYLTADEGVANVNGHDVTTNQKVQQSIGYLAEHNPLYLDLYVEYLAFNADVYKVKKESKK
jgi:ABC-2 type transport system ATP-binding protein